MRNYSNVAKCVNYGVSLLWSQFKYVYNLEMGIMQGFPTAVGSFSKVNVGECFLNLCPNIKPQNPKPKNVFVSCDRCDNM